MVDHYRDDPNQPRGDQASASDLNGLFTHTDSLYTHHQLDETQRIYLNPPPPPARSPYHHDRDQPNRQRQPPPRPPLPNPQRQRPTQPRASSRDGAPSHRSPVPRSQSRASRRKKSAKPRWRRYLVRSLIGLVVVLLIGSGYAGYEYLKLNGNINRVDVLQGGDKSIKNAAKQRDAQNFLLIGSDTRTGANAEYEAEPGAVIGARSDTTILAHLSPGGKKAILVSFPRDAWVNIPSCTRANGTTSAVQQQMFNAAFTIGGPACTIRTIQQMTGIQINHYIQVDFAGFKNIVDALGGVPICSPRPVHDRISGLQLTTGNQMLNGEQALAYVRARHNVGDGSDLGRIKRQQRFLGAMMRTAAQSDVLLDPLKITHLLDAATKTLTMDKDTSLTDLKNLASALNGLDPARVSFLTAPIADPDYTPPGSTGGGRVLLDSVAGGQLWNSIIDDKPMSTGSSSAPADAPKSEQAADKPPTNTGPVPDMPVEVINGTGTDGLASKTATDLKQRGFSVARTGNLVGPAAPQTLVRYPTGKQTEAQALANAVPGAVLREDGTLSSNLILVLGQSTADNAAPQAANPPQATDANAKPQEPDLDNAINGSDTTCTE